MKQVKLAQQLGISESYWSMMLSKTEDKCDSQYSRSNKV